MNKLIPQKQSTDMLEKLIRSGEMKDIIINYVSGPFSRVHFTKYKNGNFNIHITSRK